MIFQTLQEFDDDGDILPQPLLPFGTRRHHLVNHDESTVNANDSTSYSWKKVGSEWLKPKSKGKGIIVSDFLCATYRRIHYIDHDSSKPVYATEIIKYGSRKNDASWWDAKKMVEQTKKTIAIFNNVTWATGVGQVQGEVLISCLAGCSKLA